MPSYLSCVCLAVPILYCTITVTGCGTHDPRSPPAPVTPSAYRSPDDDDLRWLGEHMAGDLLSVHFIEKSRHPPTAVILIDNRTADNLNMLTISDAMRDRLSGKGSVTILDSRSLDVAAKSGAFPGTADSRVLVARQMGVKYILLGSLVLVSRDNTRFVNTGPKGRVVFQLNLEVTDVASGLVAWMGQKQRIRGASSPLLGR